MNPEQVGTMPGNGRRGKTDPSLAGYPTRERNDGRYYFGMSFNLDGEEIEMGGRDMFVFVKEEGKWLAVADQFSSYPEENT